MDKRIFAGREKGFTLIELLVVVLIIGILAAIAVPQYFKVVEKGKAAEAFNWLQALKGSQEAHLARTGQYATHVTLLDVNVAAMRNFVNPTAVTSAGVIAVAAATANPPTWQVSVIRNGTPANYGNYRILFTGPTGSMDCNSTACAADLLP